MFKCDVMTEVHMRRVYIYVYFLNRKPTLDSLFLSLTLYVHAHAKDKKPSKRTGAHFDWLHFL